MMDSAVPTLTDSEDDSEVHNSDNEPEENFHLPCISKLVS